MKAKYRITKNSFAVYSHPYYHDVIVLITDITKNVYSYETVFGGYSSGACSRSRLLNITPKQLKEIKFHIEEKQQDLDKLKSAMKKYE